MAGVATLRIPAACPETGLAAVIFNTRSIPPG